MLLCSVDPFRAEHRWAGYRHDWYLALKSLAVADEKEDLQPSTIDAHLISTGVTDIFLEQMCFYVVDDISV